MTIADTPQAPPAANAEPSHISIWDAADEVGLMPYDMFELCHAGLVASITWGESIRVEVASLREYATRLNGTTS